MRKFRVLVLIILLLLSIVLLLFSFGLINRWYGQIIGDTFKIQSKLLSDFRGEPTYLQGFVVMPLSAKENPEKRFAVLYHLHGFGADYQDAASLASRLRSNMRRYPETELVHVFLDMSLGDGYHYFVNSENNGPYESALIQEFIPALEKSFPVVPSEHARFLTGHSSGGWSALWLQINHPDFFGGVWSVSPDPVDFSEFFGIDLTEQSKDNFYRDIKGHTRKVARSGKQKKLSIEEYVAEEEEDQDTPCDSDFGSYECAFSPKQSDGNPQQLFDRADGKINMQTAQAWQHYNISNFMSLNWQRLKDKLDNKINLFCGSQDDYFLDKPFTKFCNFLKETNLQINCEIIQGRGHGNVYFPTKASPQGLGFRIEKEVHERYIESLQ